VVANTRAANGSRRDELKPRQAAPLRPLNQPRPIAVQTDERGAPVAIVVSKIRRVVESVQETWRIDDEWWRARPISRVYWRVLLEDGRTVDVYHDLVGDCWYKQAYTT
jgi:hypothetical protein